MAGQRTDLDDSRGAASRLRSHARRPLASSADRHAAVDGQHLPGDDSRLVRGKVHGHVGDVNRIHETHHMPRHQRTGWVGVDPGLHPRRARYARSDRVHPDAVGVRTRPRSTGWMASTPPRSRVAITLGRWGYDPAMEDMLMTGSHPPLRVRASRTCRRGMCRTSRVGSPARTQSQEPPSPRRRQGVDPPAVLHKTVRLPNSLTTLAIASRTLSVSPTSQ